MVQLASKKKKIDSPRRRLLLKLLLVAIVIFLLGKFVVQIYRIPTGSMEDTLLVGDWVVVNKLAYRFGAPQPCDIIVFKYPLNPSKTLIKRCVATEGQTVEIVGKVVSVDGKMFRDSEKDKFTDKYIIPTLYSTRDNFGPIQVPIDELFVLGDNRDNSEDSRAWGFVEKGNIKGKIDLVIFSWAPDPNAPKLRSPYVLPLIEIFFYNLYHIPDRVRWSRIGTGAR
ncbi:MAG: signal peptidase I [candidate division Zixibacteria bacterium]|nr:signal peptidase I [candidate division Zixibacteria bacterium]